MDPSPGSRTLLLLRHAKSSWEEDLPDHDRPLSARGRRDALAAGGWLRDHDLHPDLVLCSTATRTRQTWARAVEGGADAAEVRYADEVYGAWVPELVAVLRQVPDAVRTLLVVGHAPGIPDLVPHLCSRDSGPAWSQLESKYPTSGLAMLDLGDPWSALGKSCATLRDFVVPRG